MRSNLKSLFRGWAKELKYHAEQRLKCRNIENRNPIFIYQMGKVGSSTVTCTLERSKIQYPTFQVHHLNPQKVYNDIDALRENPGYLQKHVVTSLTLLKKKLDWGQFPCNVITLTREPVGRVISFVFQDWRRQFPDVETVRELDADRMIKLIREKLSPGSPHSNPGQWFDRELKSVFGIDVMSVPYNFERGYVKLKSGPVNVLVVRMEDLDNSLENALADLFDLENGKVQVVRSNIGQDKKYADLLAEVKNQFTLPSSVANRLWGTDYVQHFYGPDLVRLREKWEE